MKAHKKLWVWLYDVQIGLILTTLAKIQLFFSSEEKEYEGQASQNRFNESVRSYLADQIESFRSGWSFLLGFFSMSETNSTDWDLILENCEALVVENPDTPECIPMEIRNAHFKTRGKPTKMNIEVEGNISLFSFMIKESDASDLAPTKRKPGTSTISPIVPHPGEEPVVAGDEGVDEEDEDFFDAIDELPNVNAMNFVRESLTRPFDIEVR